MLHFEDFKFLKSSLLWTNDSFAFTFHFIVPFLLFLLFVYYSISAKVWILLNYCINVAFFDIIIMIMHKNFFWMMSHGKLTCHEKIINVFYFVLFNFVWFVIFPNDGIMNCILIMAMKNIKVFFSPILSIKFFWSHFTMMYNVCIFIMQCICL